MRISVFITAPIIARYLNSKEDIERAIAQLHAHHAERVFIESRRGPVSTPEEKLRELRDEFLNAGFETAGGIMPIGQRNDFGRGDDLLELSNEFLCYCSSETGDVFEFEIRKMARVFNTIILDDAFLTGCRCPNCQAEKDRQKTEDWGHFRRDLMVKFSAERVLKPAREENPGIKMIIKFPQYYDRYPDLGYDPIRQTEMFDAIWAGAETRDPWTIDYGYVPPYESQAHIRYLRSIAGDKLEGAWFDSLDCTPGLFRDQAIITALTGIPEITIFCYDPEIFALDSAMTACVREDYELLQELSQAATNVSGSDLPNVVWYRPAEADGGEDISLPDFLGMWSLPVDVQTQRPLDAKVVILSTHSLADPDPQGLLETLEANDVRIIATCGFLYGLKDNEEVLHRFGLRGLYPLRVPVQRLSVGDEWIDVSEPLSLPYNLAPLPGLKAVLAQTAEVCEHTFRIPLWLEAGPHHAALNLRTFGRQDYSIVEALNVPIVTDYVNVPVAVVSKIRAWCLEPFELEVEAPNWTCLFALRDGKLALVRPHASAATVQVNWKGSSKLVAVPSHDAVIFDPAQV